MSAPVSNLNRLLCLLALCASGCINQWTTRMPRCGWESNESQRRGAQVYDPFPDSKVGPYVGFRPLEFQNQRSEAQQAKDNFFAGTIAPRPSIQAAPQPGAAPPTPPPGGVLPAPSPTGYSPPPATGYYPPPGAVVPVGGAYPAAGMWPGPMY